MSRTPLVVLVAVVVALGVACGGDATCETGREIEGEDGLIYENTACGDGAEAEPGDTLVVHYTGKLADGTEFDSSLQRGEPIEFVLGAGDVIEGWDIGLEGMREGGERILTIPPDLGYGAGGTPLIPPNSTLIFDLELLEVRSDD